MELVVLDPVLLAGVVGAAERPSGNIGRVVLIFSVVASLVAVPMIAILTDPRRSGRSRDEEQVADPELPDAEQNTADEDGSAPGPQAGDGPSR